MGKKWPEQLVYPGSTHSSLVTSLLKGVCAAVEWSSKRPKRLGGQARATLDKLFQHTPRLDKTLLDEVCTVHRISRQEAQAYFRSLQQGAQEQAVQDESWREQPQEWE